MNKIRLLMSEYHVQEYNCKLRCKDEKSQELFKRTLKVAKRGRE